LTRLGFDPWREAARLSELPRETAARAFAVTIACFPKETGREDTDLERRVLAHERILQAFIAHIAEAEPEFIARLSAVFSQTSQMGRREYDYTDTHAYADQFIQEVFRLIERRAGGRSRWCRC
jgi:hypothetical protein